MPDPQLERMLQDRIDPWLVHMRWRADFAQWRERRLWQENYQARALAELRRVLPDNPAARVLDLGAGMGGFAVALARENRAVVALDYNPAYCEIARLRARRYDLDLPTLVAAGEALPFTDASFQVITCWDVVEHVQDPAQLLRELARVLVPGGTAFVTVINRLALTDPHYHLRFVNWLPRALGEKYIAWRRRTKQAPLRDRQSLGAMHYFTFDAFRQLAGRFGFQVCDLNREQSRFNRYPRVPGAALYLAWRSIGMGTYRLALAKAPAGGKV